MNREISLKNSLIIILLASCIFRSLSFFGIGHLSGGYDEHVYRSYCAVLADKGVSGLREQVRHFDKEERINKGALPFRIFYTGLGVIFCKALGNCNFFTLALISYLFGMATVIVALLFFRKLFPPLIALLAALLLVVSPLSAALANRALQDSLFAFLVISSFYFYHKYWIKTKLIDLIIFGLLVLCGFLTKESMSFVYFCFFATGLYYYKKNKQTFIWENIFVALSLAFLSFILISAWIAGGLKPLVESYFKYFSLQSVNEFAIVSHQGPWFKYIVDYFLISPAIILLAVVGATSVLKDQRINLGKNICLIYVLSGLFIFTCFTIKNVRYVLFVDVFLRALAVLGIYSLTEKINSLSLQRLLRIALIAVVFLSDFYQYLILFVKWQIYDPVSGALVIANGFFKL